MGQTNFGLLTDEQKTVWSRETWMQARNHNYFEKFTGEQDAMVHRVTELTADEKGTRAVITLVADLEGDGVAGDNQLDGNEEEGRAFDEVIQIDQLRHGMISKGRMAEQGTVVRFRETAQNVLAHWLGDRFTQMMFLTLSGVAYTSNPDGTTRVGSQLSQLDYASDVTTPTSNRHFRWDETTTKTLLAAGTASVAATDLPSYQMLIMMKAKAQEQLLRPIRGEGELVGLETYYIFMTPAGMAALKKDSQFNAHLKDAMPRAPNNPLFKGADTYWIDGMVIYVHNHVFHASTWGGGAVNGQAVLMCGAQALGMADIGDPIWEEEIKDYKARPGISVGKIAGIKKPVFRSNVTGTDEDFGVIRVDTAV